MKLTMSLFLFVLWSLPAYSLEVGEMAPNFSLQGTDGIVHNLSDYRGKKAVVLAWFPRAYTLGCTIECKSLAENGHLLEKFEAIYFMASVDPIDDNIGFAEQQKADFPLLSDPTTQAAKAYGVLKGGFAARHTFYIGKDGKILAIDRKVKPASSAQDMAKKLAALEIPLVGEGGGSEVLAEKKDSTDQPDSNNDKTKNEVSAKDTVKKKPADKAKEVETDKDNVAKKPADTVTTK